MATYVSVTAAGGVVRISVLKTAVTQAVPALTVTVAFKRKVLMTKLASNAFLTPTVVTTLTITNPSSLTVKLAVLRTMIT